VGSLLFEGFEVLNMGIFDGESEEVEISPDDESGGKLKDEVESEVSGSPRGQEIRERSKEKGKSTFDEGVSLEDVHKQNQKIIGMLEQLTGNERDVEDDSEGDFDGVL
jgi:hypothetical protein